MNLRVPRLMIAASAIATSTLCLAADLAAQGAPDAASPMVGKYLCVVMHSSGIQYQSNGRTISGRVKRTQEKFTLSIRPRASFQSDPCSWEPSTGRPYWLGCVAKFEVQIDDEPPMRGDDQHEFYGFSDGDFLEVGDDLTFRRFQAVASSNGLFIEDGRCNRL